MLPTRVALSDGWLAIGDAAFAFDPLYGRGVTEALASGYAASDWLCGGRNSDAIPMWIARVADRFNTYRVQRTRIYSQETRWTSSAFWQRRQQEQGVSNAFADTTASELAVLLR